MSGQRSQASSSAASTASVPGGVSADAAEVLDVRELLKGSREVHLRLDNTIYRLRLTRFGKLVLTK